MLCVADNTEYSSMRLSETDAIIGSRAASFKQPLLSVDVSVVCLYVCLCVGNFDAKYLETKRFMCLCPIGSLQKSAYGASIGNVIEYVT